MLLLAHDDVAGILSQDEVIATVRAGFAEQARGAVQVPPRITIDSISKNGWLRVMPGILNESGVMGYKAMHSTPGVGVGYLVALYDLESGALLAQLDADWLTSQRTAATGAVGADVLARRDAATIGVLGSSEQARVMLAAVARVRPPRAVRVYSPTPANRRAFAETMAERLDAAVTPVETPREAVAGCDLVVSVFRASNEPVIRADWLEPGVHLVAASSVRPEAREMDAAVWSRADCIAVDDREHALDSGDGRAALASGDAKRERVAELWELVAGAQAGRERPSDITVFKSVGSALQDLVLADAIYRRALREGRGRALGAFPRMRR